MIAFVFLIPSKISLCVWRSLTVRTYSLSFAGTARGRRSYCNREPVAQPADDSDPRSCGRRSTDWPPSTMRMGPPCPWTTVSSCSPAVAGDVAPAPAAAAPVANADEAAWTGQCPHSH